MIIDFEKYDKENPQVWNEFVKWSKLTKERGFKNYSANGIFEIIRWHTGVEGEGVYKVNNNYRPDYARKMMKEYPEFEGFFRVRETKAPRS